MKKLKRILAMAEHPDEMPAVLGKAASLALTLLARVEVVVTGAAQMRAVIALCVANAYDDVVVTCVHRGSASIVDLIRNRVSLAHYDVLVLGLGPDDESAEAAGEATRRIVEASKGELVLVRTPASRPAPRVPAPPFRSRAATASGSTDSRN